MSKLIIGVNDLATTYPELAKEWHPTKNGKLTLEQVTAGSNKKVWWQCAKGHEWETTPFHRLEGNGCPICSGRKVLSGFNDLATTHPELAKEWHPTKNGEFTPEKVIAGSHRKVWWQCAKGHEWQSVINNRTRLHRGCPVCQKENQTSFAEQTIFFYLNQLTTTENRYLLDGKTEIDIYLPVYKIGIEYDGLHYHKGKISERREKAKNETTQAAGITLIRIKEVKNLAGYVDNKGVIYCKYADNRESYLKEILEKIINRINGLTNNHFQVDINIDRDRWEIYNRYIENEKQNSLALKNPELAADWHPTKNGKLTPEKVNQCSGKKVWWLGKCGHEWQACISHRATQKCGCPYCSGHKVLPGFNDLATVNPTLTAEWHPTKNGELTPEQVSAYSHKKVWWLGKCGHEWEAVIKNRHFAGRGCPYCSNQKILPGFNDLATTNPELAADWHPTKNGDLKSSDVPKSARQSAWWLGKCGHEWEAPIYSRDGGNGCPYCSGHKVLPGFNDLATVNPRLANDWHPTKNGKLTPEQVTAGSNKKVWWQCSVCGYEWKTIINSRNQGHGCPACAGKVPCNKQ